MKQIVLFGEVLMRLSAPGNLRLGQTNHLELHHAGAEYNSAISLGLLGERVRFVTRLPEHQPIAEASIRQLQAYGVDTSCIQRGGDRMGIYFLEQGAMMRSSQVVYDRAHSSMATLPEHCFDWDTCLQDADWLHITGITPAISAAAAAETLKAVKVAHKAGLQVSCDLNYRSKLWQYGVTPGEVMHSIVQHCSVVLGDIDTVATYFSIQANGADIQEQCVSSMRQLMQMFPSLQQVVYSYRMQYGANRNDFGAVLYNGKESCYSRRYVLDDIVDRLGGGDALMAGFIYGIRHYPAQQAVDFAVAASVLKATIPGDTNFVGLQEIESVAAGVQHGRIQR
jgi:2-dehydro-3-deoxygluconokinase